ncbi:unnamed protein product [Withania somnifera]
MANFLSQFQSIKTTCDHLVIAVEDVSDLWPLVKKGFEDHLPFKRAFLNNKTRNPVLVDELPAEYILTTDSRLRSRFPQEQSLFWFREPYATVVLVSCEDLDEFKTILKPRLKLIVQNDEREWFIVFVSKAASHNDQATKMAKKYMLNLKLILAPRREKVNMTGKQREFGGMDSGDDQAALLNPGKKALNQIVQDDSFREFDFRQYLFSCQSKLLFKLTRPFEVASRGHSFIISFSKALSLHESVLPFCTREVWVITASLALIAATASQYKDGQVATDIEKEFYRVQGDLYSLCRTKFMRLAYLIGYGLHIERSPVNSAALSMLPWPKPGVWPSLPPDAASEVLVKEKMMFEENLRVKHFGIQRKPLPLEPSVLLREANRRRASISAGNVFEMFDGHPYAIDGSGSMSSPAKAQSISMSRTNSSPGNFESSISRPLRLSEICVVAEHALRNTISDAELWKSLSSAQEFEQKYLELSKGAADNYHRSWWKRHGVVLDGEIAAVFHKNGNYDLAAKLYEKVCALYAGEGWQNLLAEVLPNLAECQKELGDQAGYLSSCVRLLSLDKGLFSCKERQAFQSEVVRLAHSEMEHTVPLDVSSLITFSGNPGPPLQLCAGDPGTLAVTVWSGFPDDITLESLSLTLTATFNTDEGVKAIERSGETILKPGRNTIMINLPPQKPGSYVLGVLTGKIGLLSFRSHSFSKGAPADSDDFMSYEKPTRPILKVFKPRSLVDLTAAVSSALLMNEPQWVGIIVKPISYSLKGAILHIDTGPGLTIERSHKIEIERHVNGNTDELDNSEGSKDDDTSAVTSEVKQMSLHDGVIELPDWASDVTSVLWIPVRATSDELPKGAPAGAVVPQSQNLVEGLRTIALKLEFGVSRNQIFERTIAVHFTDPFSVSTRVMDKGTDGKLLLQVILQSQVQATLTIYDSWLDLQEGFAHTRNGDNKPISGFFPIVISPKCRAGILFSVCLASAPIKEEAVIQCPESILNIRFDILGNRAAGAHDPNVEEPSGHDGSAQSLIFKSSILLQRPVLDPCFAVGFLPLSSTDLQVGQLVSMRWRVERLKSLEEYAASENNDDVLYEVHANSDHWMIAGRKRGHVLLSTRQGSRITISVLCMPLVAGYVRPPQLGLPNVEKANICCNPPSPHLVCVFPPSLSSSFCIPA